MIKKDIPKLIDAICDGISNALPGKPWAPHDNGISGITTYCNYFVSSVCKAMGYGVFTDEGHSSPWIANRICEFLSVPDYGWLDIVGETAQFHANSGALVIAAQSNPSGHGHVCIVRPGNMMMSAHWNKLVPRVANVGKDVFINQSASFSFETEPDYYVLAQMV